MRCHGIAYDRSHCLVYFSCFCGIFNAPMSSRNFGFGIRRFSFKYFTSSLVGLQNIWKSKHLIFSSNSIDCNVHLKCSMPSNSILPDRISSGKFVMIIFDFRSVGRFAIPSRRKVRRSAANIRSTQRSMDS